jgi:hypothetical protein
MRRRSAPPPSAQQMIREYLGRVSVAATKVLPKGDRLLFVGRTRAAIEAKVGPLASADADAVQNALTTMGAPEELAQRERERLYSARRRGAAAAPPALWKPSKESRRGAPGSRRGAPGSGRGAAGSGRGAPGSGGGADPPPAREQGAPQGRRRPRPWPHRGLTGPDEPQPAETASASAPQKPVPAVPRQADSPEEMSPPVEASPSAEVSPPPEASRREASPGEVPRPRMPPEQAMEEGWPAEPAAAGNASAEPAAVEPAAVEPSPVEPSLPGNASAGNGSAVGVPVPDLAGLEADAPEPDAPEPDVPVTGTPGAATPGSGGPERNGTPPGWLRPGRPTPAPAPDEAKPLSIVPGMSESGEPEDHPVSGRRSVAGWRSPVVALLAEAWALARKHPLEAVAVVLLGLGGLILPFPFWLIGGLVALRSRRWDARDKWIALAGPPLVTFVVLLTRAVTSQGNLFSAFYHASEHDVGLSIRVGCVLCAGYLIWRLRRGPRLRTLPPWQRPR